MNKYHLSDHTKRQHAGDGSNSFVCHRCYTRKPNSHLLRKIMRHGKVDEVQMCKDCGIYFNSKKDLRNHKFQVYARRKGKKDDPFAAIENAGFVLI